MSPAELQARVELLEKLLKKAVYCLKEADDLLGETDEFKYDGDPGYAPFVREINRALGAV